ncbi:hypothetical protein ACFSJU_07665 [Paradesertivirga mongoliensis]|uniref:Fibronectin type-III domain-containing protein n=1 Tax=Paradesertivirga mongoliensis TaxID=2100740 RepID=A0ABW4ZKC2_9SPHI|nr:hypothetical protein [Pedobacter mongoliensis]
MKLNLTLKSGAVLFCLLLLSSCSEFIEKDLDDSKVFLTSPGDNHETNKYNQTFWWEPIDNASYRLQIASPSFTNIAELLIDTLIKGNNKFSITLDPGEYEWRVRAENSGTSGLYSTRSLVVHESSIAAQQIQVKGPGSGYITNQKNITFNWYGLFGSEMYRIQIDTNNFSDPAKLVFDSATPSLSHAVSLTKDQSYQWRIRAEAGADEVSKWSPIFQFTLDATAPDKVNLSLPSNGQVVNKPVTLQWAGVEGASKYQLVVYKADGGTNYNSSYPMLLNGTSFSFNEGQFNETLYWKVRAVDAAGNYGAFSEVRSFTVQ